jgi:hypothetical protein
MNASSENKSMEQKIDSTAFWHIVLPLLTLIIVFAVLFMIYTLPDWALTCSSGLESVRRLASRNTQ